MTREIKGVKAILIIKEVDYAVRILSELHKNGPLSAADLAERQNIPSPFIYRVLKKLEAADILSIRRGPGGGYNIKTHCGQLTLYDVICAFENTFFVIECMKSGYKCNHNGGSGCALHREFAGLQILLRNEFRRNNLEYLFTE